VREHTWCVGKYYRGFVGNFILVSAVKEFWKSVKIWESYCQRSGWLPFLEHSVHEYVLHLVDI